MKPEHKGCSVNMPCCSSIALSDASAIAACWLTVVQTHQAFVPDVTSRKMGRRQADKLHSACLLLQHAKSAQAMVPVMTASDTPPCSAWCRSCLVQVYLSAALWHAVSCIAADADAEAAQSNVLKIGCAVQMGKAQGWGRTWCIMRRGILDKGCSSTRTKTATPSWKWLRAWSSGRFLVTAITNPARSTHMPTAALVL